MKSTVCDRVGDSYGEVSGTQSKKKSRAVMEGGGEGTLYWPGALSTLLLPADAQNHKKYHSLVKKWLEG